MTATRPDILFVVSILCRFMTNSKRSHWEAGKRVLRYILLAPLILKFIIRKFQNQCCLVFVIATRVVICG